MFAVLYTIGIQVALLLAKVVALFHPKTRRWVEGQKSVWSSQFTVDSLQFTEGSGGGDFAQKKPILWFHAASLGEFEQGRPVIEAFRRQYPQCRIWLTFFSPSGYQMRQDYDGADVVTYLPADTPANVRRFLDVVRPSMVFFVKYEFWYNYLTELKKRKIPTFLVSAIFRPNQLFFKSYGGFYRKMLFCFDHIFVQNQASQQLLARVGCTSVTLAGDTRLDRVAQIAQQARPLPEIAAFKGTDPLLIVGSAWPDDMEMLIPFLNRWPYPLKVLIAPHEINPAQIEEWRNQLRDSLLFTVYSLQFTVEGIKPQLAKPQTFKLSNVMFLDTVGMLAATYQYADFVYIGGAFGDGLHNILEPAAFGMPLFFGKPHYDKFQEAYDLLALGAAQSVGTTKEFEGALEKVYQHLDERQRQAALCRAYVQHHLGATEKVLQTIREDFCI